MTMDNEQIAVIRKRCKKKDLGVCCGLYAERLRPGMHSPESKKCPAEIENWLDTLLPEIKNQEELTKILARCIRKIANAGLSVDDISHIVDAEISRILKNRLRQKRKYRERIAKEHEEKKELSKV